MNRQELRKLRKDKDKYAKHLEAKRLLNAFVGAVSGVKEAEEYNNLYKEHKEIWFKFAKRNGYNTDYFEMMFVMDFDKAKEFEQTKDFTAKQLIEGIIGRYRRIQNYKQMPYRRPLPEGCDENSTAQELALANNLEKQK